MSELDVTTEDAEIKEANKLRALVLKRFSRVTPTRLGMVAGEECIRMANPYVPGSRGYKCFREGYEFGVLTRIRKIINSA